MLADEEQSQKNKSSLRPITSAASLTAGIFYLLVFLLNGFGISLEHNIVALSIVSGISVALTNILRYLGNVLYVDPYHLQMWLHLKHELWCLQRARKKFKDKSRAADALDLNEKIAKTKDALHKLRFTIVEAAEDNAKANQGK